MEAWQQFGLDLIAHLQQLPRALDAPMRLFTELGRGTFLYSLPAFIYWCVDSAVGIRLALLLVVSTETNGWLKLMLHEPRPYWLNPSLQRDAETSYGIPSGHAQSAVVVWGYLAASVRRRWAWAVAGLVAFLISFSRLYLGVHFPHDVLVGWALGATGLWLFLWAAPRCATWLRERPWVLVGSAVALSAVVFVVPRLLVGVLAGTPDPAAWASSSGDARDAGGSSNMAGVLLGAVVGYALQRRLVRFSAGGSAAQRLARLVLGLAGMFGLAFLLSLVPHPGAELTTDLWRVLRSAIVMLWVAFAAPWVFVRTGLAAGRPALKLLE